MHGLVHADLNATVLDLTAVPRYVRRGRPSDCVGGQTASKASGQGLPKRVASGWVGYVLGDLDRRTSVEGRLEANIYRAGRDLKWKELAVISGYSEKK
jgi:hypothetical protein